MRAHLPLSPVILYSVWFFSPLSVSRSHPVPAGEQSTLRLTGMDGWTGFNLDRQSWITQTVTKIYLHSTSLTASSIWFFSEASGACIILACANANGSQKLRRIYADMKGYRLLQIWLVIVSDFGFSCKVSCKRINLVAKVHAHPPEDFCSHGNCMYFRSILIAPELKLAQLGMPTIQNYTQVSWIKGNRTAVHIKSLWDTVFSPSIGISHPNSWDWFCIQDSMLQLQIRMEYKR